MNLGEAGEARLRGYLFVLGRALQAFLPKAVAQDALTEIQSHLRERIAESEAQPDEAIALERLLEEFGRPEKVAQAYAGEVAIEEALATGRVTATARALWHLSTTTVQGFFLALGLLVGYLFGLALVAIAAAKPILPNNTGVLIRDGVPRAIGIFSNLGEGAEVWGGYWVIPVALTLGLLTLVATHRGAMRFLGWWRNRRNARRYLADPSLR